MFTNRKNACGTITALKQFEGPSQATHSPAAIISQDQTFTESPVSASAAPGNAGAQNPPATNLFRNNSQGLGGDGGNVNCICEKSEALTVNHCKA